VYKRQTSNGIYDEVPTGNQRREYHRGDGCPDQRLGV